MSAVWSSALTWINNRWSPVGLFDYTPPDLWRFRDLYLFFIAFCLIAALALSFLRIPRSLKEKLSPFFWTNTILGFILFFFRYAQVPLFGMDIWRFLQELGIVTWLVMIVRFSRKHLGEESLAEKVEDYRNKYLPKAKKVKSSR